MVRKVPDSPILPRPRGEDTVVPFLKTFSAILSQILNNISYRVNRLLSVDGQDAMTGPLVLQTFTVATVPTAADWTQGLIFVSDETGGATIAFSDGTNWRRLQDLVIVS